MKPTNQKYLTVARMDGVGVTVSSGSVSGGSSWVLLHRSRVAA